MYQQQQKQPFCALTLYLNPTGNKSPKFEYKADAKSLFTCSLTKKKYKLSQINEWFWCLMPLWVISPWQA